MSYTRLASDSDLEMAWPPDANLERNCGANVGIDISDVDRYRRVRGSAEALTSGVRPARLRRPDDDGRRGTSEK